MFIELTITWVPSGFSGYIWLDTKIVFKKKNSGPSRHTTVEHKTTWALQVALYMTESIQVISQKKSKYRTMPGVEDVVIHTIECRTMNGQTLS